MHLSAIVSEAVATEPGNHRFVPIQKRRPIDLAGQLHRVRERLEGVARTSGHYQVAASSKRACYRTVSASASSRIPR